MVHRWGMFAHPCVRLGGRDWWQRLDLNLRPRAYEASFDTLYLLSMLYFGTLPQVR